MKDTILTVHNISYKYNKESANSDQLILDKINFDVKEGEIIGIIGKSGSGKSTLLRILANLVLPSEGEMFFTCKEFNCMPVAMVFQNFALFPWLTILENVELGLQATNELSEKEVREKALKTIDLIGLDGYESAYPKEISGGMKQRVGFARALAVEPTVLLLDEPFSALDVLSAETLRQDFLDLWIAGKTKMKSVIMVSHNIEEAVALCDRIFIISSNPGKFVTEIKVNLPHPRDKLSSKFKQLTDDIYAFMLEKIQKIDTTKNSNVTLGDIGISKLLPDTSPSQMTGFLETLCDETNNGTIKISDIRIIFKNVLNIFDVIEGLQLLKFIKITDDKIITTSSGNLLVNSDIIKRKAIFAEHIINNVPLASYIKRSLDQSIKDIVNKKSIIKKLSKHTSPNYAEKMIKTIINWGRYAELFSYNDDKAEFNLENPNVNEIQ